MIKGKRKVASEASSSSKSAKIDDPFQQHFCRDLEPTVAERLLQEQLSSMPSSSVVLQVCSYTSLFIIFEN